MNTSRVTGTLIMVVAQFLMGIVFAGLSVCGAEPGGTGAKKKSGTHSVFTNGRQLPTRFSSDTHVGPIPRFNPPDQFEQLKILIERNVSVSFAGYLVAIEEGYYEAEGLPPVSAVLLDANSTVMREFFSGNVQFGTNMLPHVCRYVSEGHDLVVLSQLVKNSTFGIAVRTDLYPDIKRINDLDGRRIAVFYRDEENLYIPLSVAGVDATIVPIQTRGSTLFRKGIIQGLCARTYDYPVVARYLKQRNHIRFFPLTATGCDLPEDCLMCMRPLLFKHPDLCRKFVLASYRGWKQAFANKDKTVEILTKWYRERNMLLDGTVAMEELIEFERVLNLKSLLQGTGSLTEETYQNMLNHLVEAKLVDRDRCPAFDKVYYPLLFSSTMERLKKDVKSARSPQNAEKGSASRSSEVKP